MALMVLPAGNPVDFHPTDVLLVNDFLKRKLMGMPIPTNVVTQLNIYKFDPWDLPGMSPLRNSYPEWYFFCPRGGWGTRTSRTTHNGYWLASGKAKEIVDNFVIVGKRRTLIFHIGKAPHGRRTNWIMHEYRLETTELIKEGLSKEHEKIALVKIFQKNGQGPKNRLQHSAPFILPNRTDTTEKTHGLASPCLNDHAFMPDPLPLPQFSPIEGGESSSMASMQSFNEAGAPSSIPVQSSVASDGERFSAASVSRFGRTSSVPTLSSALEDMEMLLLNSSPPHQENANVENIVSQFLSEDFCGTFDEEMIEVEEPGIGLNDMLPLEDMSSHGSLPPSSSQFPTYNMDISEFSLPSSTHHGFANTSRAEDLSSIFMNYVDANIGNYDMLPASTGSALVPNVQTAVNELGVPSPSEPEPGIGVVDLFSFDQEDPENIFALDVDLDNVEDTDENFAEYLKYKSELFSGVEDLPWLAEPNYFDRADSSSLPSKPCGNATDL